MPRKKIPWTPKKSLALAGVFFILVCFGLCFIPMFSCMDADKKFYNGNIIEAFLHPEEGTALWLAFLGFGLFVAFELLAIFLLLRSVFADPDNGDSEDKSFVFGYFFLALGFGIFLLYCFSMHHTVAIFLGIIGIAVGIIAVVIHYKKLSNI